MSSEENKRVSELNNLSKEELVKLSNDLMHWQELNYKLLKEKIQDVGESFFIMTGNFSAIKSKFNITDNTK